MKVVNLVLQVFFLLVILLFLIYFLTGYDSAFEADQYCHSYLSSYDNSSEHYGCDHDTETHQWILYESNDTKEPAKIIKKFRYKFL
jgi:ammonia channel protein AmtB